MHSATSKKLYVASFAAFLVISGFFLFKNGFLANRIILTIPRTLTPTAAPEIPKTCSGKQTAQLEEGPYYTANTPQKDDFSIDAATGAKLILTGYVFDTDCKPVAGAWLDFWQADGKGNYDNKGYILRGHQFTDHDGKFKLTTVMPGEYPGRTPHIHVKVRAADSSPILTTQIFIPGLVTNANDNIYNPTLLMTMSDKQHASFNFVVSK